MNGMPLAVVVSMATMDNAVRRRRMEADCAPNPEDRVAQLMEEPCFCSEDVIDGVKYVVLCPRDWELNELGRLIRDGAGLPELANRVIRPDD